MKERKQESQSWEPEVFEAGVGGAAGAGEILVPFSQVHRVVSDAIGSRFWRLQEGGSSEDEDIILAEVAVESKIVNRAADLTGDFPISSQGIGIQSPISSSFRRSLQVGGRGDFGQGSSSTASNDLLFGDAIAAGYSPAELRKVGILPSRSVRMADAGRPWQGPVPPPRVLPPVTVGDVFYRASHRDQIRSGNRGLRAAVPPKLLPVQNPSVTALRPGYSTACFPTAFSDLDQAHGHSIACLPAAFSGSDQARKQGLPWLRRVFHQNWRRNR